MKRAELILAIRARIEAELADAGGRMPPADLVARITKALRCAQKLVEKTLDVMVLEPPQTLAPEATETANEDGDDMAKKKPEAPKAKPTPKPKKAAPPEPPPLFDDEPPTDAEIAEAEKRDAEAAAKATPAVEKPQPKKKPKDDEPTEAEIEKAKVTEPVRGQLMLEHVFSREDIDGLHKAMLDIDVEIERLDVEIDEAKEKLSDLRKSSEQKLDERMQISKRVRDGKEARPVFCEDRKEYDAREGSPTHGKPMVVTYRLDTKQPIKWRDPTPAERQLDFVKGDAPTPAAPEKKKRSGKKPPQESAVA